jgi:hypothetical protein
MYSGSQVQGTKKIQHFWFFYNKKILTFNMLVIYNSRQFAMSLGSYDLNLGSEILVLVGDIRSRSWPNIGGKYGTSN